MIPCDENEEWSCMKSLKPEVFHLWWLELWSWYTSDGDGKDDKDYDSQFSRKSYGNLKPYENSRQQSKEKGWVGVLGVLKMK